jgi:hypothetical protein
MEYNKEKIEEAKALAAEILELNQILPDDRSVDISISGAPRPACTVEFYVRNPRTMDFKMENIFSIPLSEANKDNRFDEIRAYMNKWKEAYCKWI